MYCENTCRSVFQTTFIIAEHRYNILVADFRWIKVVAYACLKLLNSEHLIAIS